MVAFTFAFTIRVSVICPRHVVHILKFAEESRTNVVAELVHDGYWRAGELRLARALGGTSLAAVTYYFQQQQQIRVYYQAADLTLREHAHSSGTWFEGQLISLVQPNLVHRTDGNS